MTAKEARSAAAQNLKTATAIELKQIMSKITEAVQKGLFNVQMGEISSEAQKSLRRPRLFNQVVSRGLSGL